MLITGCSPNQAEEKAAFVYDMSNPNAFTGEEIKDENDKLIGLRMTFSIDAYRPADPVGTVYEGVTAVINLKYQYTGKTLTEAKYVKNLKFTKGTPTTFSFETYPDMTGFQEFSCTSISFY